MKFAKLIEKLGDFLSADRRRQRDKRNKLKELLKQMKKQQKELEQDLEDASDPERRAGIDLKLQILIEQRKKGIHLRRDLNGKH